MGGDGQSALQETKKAKKKKKFSISTLIIVLILVAGLCVMFYPTFSDWYNSFHQSRAIADYTQTVDENSDEKNKELWQQAKAYNEKIAQKGIDLSLTNEDDSSPDKQEYLQTLDVTGTGIMGYISIPSVHIRLPIYHDTSESILQVAVGHLAGTSLPVGGKNTHSVLTGHTGLPSAKLFTDIDQLKEGDIFQIIVLDHTMTYEVDDIRTVLPDEVGSLQIEEGRDLVTLVTCTPYGINTHRLLVTGHRIPNPKTQQSAESENTLMERLLPFILIAVIAAIIIVIIVILRRRKRGVPHERSR